MATDPHINPATGVWDDNYYAKNSGGGGGSFPSWNFDYEAEVQTAFEKLKPYYEKMLEFAKGDLDLAKRMIEFSYSQGMRETTQTYEQGTRTEAVTVPEETSQLWTGLNKRGLAAQPGMGRATGGLAGVEAGRLSERQAIRRTAIENAKANSEARLTSEKEFGTEEKQMGYEKTVQETGKQHEEDAMQAAMRRMQIEQANYGAQVGEATYKANQDALAMQRENLELAKKNAG